MSAVPKKQTPAGTHPSTQLLTNALLDRAAAASQRADQTSEVARAKAAGADSFLFTWHTEDGSEAELRLYYLPERAGEVLASELVSLDFRDPSPQERLHYLAAFVAELDAGADLWSRVASHLAERSRRS